MEKTIRKIQIQGNIEAVEARLTELLKNEGFGILSRNAFHEVLKEKIGVEIEPYIRLGVCNPGFAHQALEINRAVGILLPCAVYLRQVGDAVEVGFLRPEPAFGLVSEEVPEALATIGREVEARLERVLQAIEVPA